MALVPFPPDLAPGSVNSVVYFIQLAVAPVFLLAGVGTMLGVLTNRLARIIDRARRVEALHQETDDEPKRMQFRHDLGLLSRRARLVSWSISFCTSCSLFVSLIIMMLFLESLLDVHLRGVVPVLFIVAMSAFTMGLLLFLREIYLATAALRIGFHDEGGA